MKDSRWEQDYRTRYHPCSLEVKTTRTVGLWDDMTC